MITTGFWPPKVDKLGYGAPTTMMKHNPPMELQWKDHCEDRMKHPKTGMLPSRKGNQLSLCICFFFRNQQLIVKHRDLISHHVLEKPRSWVNPRINIGRSTMMVDYCILGHPIFGHRSPKQGGGGCWKGSVVVGLLYYLWWSVNEWKPLFTGLNWLNTYRRLWVVPFK